MSLFRQTAHELHGLLMKKEISSYELVQSIYERIDQVEEKIHAFTFQIEKDQAWPGPGKWMPASPGEKGSLL